MAKCQTVAAQLSRQWKKAWPSCTSKTVRCKMWILGRDIGWQVWVCNIMVELDLTFDLPVVSLTLKICFELYLRSHNV